MQPAPARIWSALSVYESTELVVRRLGRRREREEFDAAARAREIAAYFSQGREYFRSAAGAGELVRPLILYYGALALSRGAGLLLEPAGSDSVHSHGLGASGWADLVAEPEAISRQPVKIQKTGAFPELARVTKNRERFMVRTGREPGLASASSTGTEELSGCFITLKEVLGQIPDVAELYERTFEEHSCRLRCEVQLSGDVWRPAEASSAGVASDPSDETARDREKRRHAWLGIPSSRRELPPEDQILQAIGEEWVRPRETADNLLYFARDPRHRVGSAHLFDLYTTGGTEEHPWLEMPVTVSASGEEYLKLPTGASSGGIVLSTLLALHLAAYATSMLVRYHPGYWAMLIGRGQGDSIAPVLSAALDALERRYPELILEAIGG